MMAKLSFVLSTLKVLEKTVVVLICLPKKKFFLSIESLTVSMPVLSEVVKEARLAP